MDTDTVLVSYLLIYGHVFCQNFHVQVVLGIKSAGPGICDCKSGSTFQVAWNSCERIVGVHEFCLRSTLRIREKPWFASNFHGFQGQWNCDVCFEAGPNMSSIV